MPSFNLSADCVGDFVNTTCGQPLPKAACTFVPHCPSVQIRMMPKCWYVLFRFWLRVDNTLVRLREARYFCATATPRDVLRETKHCEGTFAELRAAGAPGTNVRALSKAPHVP